MENRYQTSGPFLTFRPILGLFLSGMMVIFMAAQGCKKLAAEAPGSLVPTDTLVEDTVRTFRMAFVGDLMCHSTQFNYARVTADSFNFKDCFSEVLPFLKEPDFTFGNFETVCAGPRIKYEGYPAFNTPDDFVDALQHAGFDLVSTSNNHSMDQGGNGALRTHEVLNSRGIGYVGTYASREDHDSLRIYEIAGTRVGFCAYTYGTNGRPVPAGKPWMCNVIDTAAVRQEIARLREGGAELVVAYFHFGKENDREPNASQKQTVNATIAAGADIIIGSHPHVIQPVEFFKTQGNATLDTGFVAWSIGNFLSNQYWRYTDAGLILNLDIGRDLRTDSLWIKEVSYLPTWVYRGRDPGKKLHVIFPAEASPDSSETKYLSAESIRKLKEAYGDTRERMHLYTKNVTELE